MDYSALLYDPVYAEIGVPATLNGVDITVIDDTRAKSQTTGSLEVRSVRPGAFARVYELTQKGITEADYVDAVLSFNGRAWTVYSYEMMGSPNGEHLGQVRFLLRTNDD